MAKVIEKTGKTIEEAISAAAEELGVDIDKLDVEVLERPTKRLFGLFGETPAKIRATVKEQPAPAAPISNEELEIRNEEPARVEEEVHVEEPEIEPVLEPSPVEEKVEPFDRDKVIDAAEDFLQDVFNGLGSHHES